MDSEYVELKTEILDPLVMRARTRVGTVLHGKYRLDVLLGVGGMAAVYAATHRNGSRAAVKLLHAELSLNPQVKSRFLREGYVANAVGHEGAVRVSDDDTAEDGSAFLVMELLDGETLEDRRVRSGGQLSEDDVLSVADQLLDVLTAAHAKGVVHRDLKPENVFVTREGRVKVLDFGIARLRELSTASTATKSGATMGTPYYMAPEQARGLWDQVDGRTDLWAVGATMYHLLSGQFVHDGRTTNEVLLAAMTKPAPPLASIAPNISPSVTYVEHRDPPGERVCPGCIARGRRHGYAPCGVSDWHGDPRAATSASAVSATARDAATPGADGCTGHADARASWPEQAELQPALHARPDDRAQTLQVGVPMTPRIVSTVLVLGATLVSLPSAAADPTKEQCIAANDHAQEFRQTAKLGKAREQLLICVAQSCPGPVREDCAQRLDELDKAMSTIVFEIKDGAGNDVAAVTVTMDGQPFARQVGGAAVAVDPGEHHFVFAQAGQPSTEKVVMVREAEKDRRVQVVLGTAPTAPSDAGQPPATPSDGSTQRMIGLVVGGAGVMGLVIGGVFGLVSKSTYNNAFQNECSSKPNGCSSQGAQDGQTAFSQATISTVGFVTGTALLAGGAVLYFTAPKGGSVAVSPTVGTNGGGFSLLAVW